MDLVNIFIGLLYLFNVVFLVVIFWMIRCIDKTYKQRQEIIAAVYSDSENWLLLAEAFQTVDYNDHMKAVLYMKDPLLIYPESIRKRMEYFYGL